ncbi:MAG: phosphoribosyltransferase [Bacteroidetes bacterium]|nr:phosphoribosyltransferase [Bacteroidota bacterium]
MKLVERFVLLLALIFLAGCTSIHPPASPIGNKTAILEEKDDSTHQGNRITIESLKSDRMLSRSPIKEMVTSETTDLDQDTEPASGLPMFGMTTNMDFIVAVGFVIAIGLILFYLMIRYRSRKRNHWWLSLGDIQFKYPCLNGVYCLGYRIGTSEDDEWTIRINNFKTGRNHHVQKAVKTLHYAAISLFERIGINPESTIVIPVLESAETSASSRSKVSRLAKSIADGASAKVELGCLTKNQHESLHSQVGKDARDAALAKAHYKAKKLEDGFENVLIVDDIVTRGKTMSAVAEAINDANPSMSIYGFALGRHQRKEWLRVPFRKANSKIPPELARIWDQA